MPRRQHRLSAIHTLSMGITVILLFFLFNFNMIYINALSTKFRSSIMLKKTSKLPFLNRKLNLFSSYANQRGNILPNDETIISLSVNWVEKWVSLIYLLYYHLFICYFSYFSHFTFWIPIAFILPCFYFILSYIYLRSLNIIYVLGLKLFYLIWE